MTLIWTPRAASDLDRMVDFISEDSPGSAARVASRIYDQVVQLSTMPHIGRIGVVPGTRELVFHPWPYIAVYRVIAESVRVIRIRHASQRWP